MQNSGQSGTEWLEIYGMSREQSSMNLDNVADRCRRNWVILFLSIILFMFDSFLLIPYSFYKAQLEISVLEF